MKGIVPALLTPFTKDGSVDYQALQAHADFLVEKGVNGLYVMGTTGEAFMATKEERKEVLEFVIKQVDGRIPVFAQIGAIPTNVACELAAHAETAGAAGIGAVTPIFHGTSQREIKEYYLEISRAVDENYPVYLYNIPGCAGNDLLPETVGELAKTANIVGIKSSMADMMRICQLIDCTPEDFDVIQGCDPLILPAVAYGAKGAVSGISNVFPELFVKLFSLLFAGDYEAARPVQALCTKATASLRYGANLAYFKLALEVRGFKKTYTRKPLLEVGKSESASFIKQIEDILKQI